MGHVVASELTSSRRQGPELRDTWQRRISPQQGGEVLGRGTRGGAGAHLCREVWSEAITYVAVRWYTPCSLSWLRACMLGYPIFRVPTNTIKYELPTTFVSLIIIMYSVILGANLPCWYDILAEVHLQGHYKVSVTWVFNYVLECNTPKNNIFLTYINSSVHMFPQTWDNFLP
jgi:hypothetical protein